MIHGTFSDDPRTLWLTQGGDDRGMQLLERFTFTDPDGIVWDAPANSVIDGASIPRSLWTLVGAPYVGDYRRGSIVHDVATVRADADKDKRRAADRMFYHACRVGGCSIEQATVLYLGVRIGAIWPSVPQWTPAYRAARRGPSLARSAAEERMESDFRQAGEMVLSEGEVDDVGEIERRVDRALRTVTLVDVQQL